MTLAHRTGSILLATLMALLLCNATPSHAESPDALFINMTTDDAHRANMGIGFGYNQLQRGPRLTVLLNDRGVMLAAKANGATFEQQQKTLSAVIAKGGTVYVCPTCMKHYGLAEADLMPGAKVSNPDLTEKALFSNDARTLSW